MEGTSRRTKLFAKIFVVFVAIQLHKNHVLLVLCHLLQSWVDHFAWPAPAVTELSDQAMVTARQQGRYDHAQPSIGSSDCETALLKMLSGWI